MSQPEARTAASQLLSLFNYINVCSATIAIRISVSEILGGLFYNFPLQQFENSK